MCKCISCHTFDLGSTAAALAGMSDRKVSIPSAGWLTKRLHESSVLKSHNLEDCLLMYISQRHFIKSHEARLSPDLLSLLQCPLCCCLLQVGSILNFSLMYFLAPTTGGAAAGGLIQRLFSDMYLRKCAPLRDCSPNCMLACALAHSTSHLLCAFKHSRLDWR